MPVIKQHISIAARGLRAFLNLEAGVGRVVPEVRQAQDQAAVQNFKQGPWQDANENGGKPAERAGGSVKPENIVWIFGSGRSGSTWLSSMMGDMSDHVMWGEPWVGTLFGNFYYGQAEKRKNHPQFILGRHREKWIGSIRSFVLNAAAATFPKLEEDDYLVIKEPNGSIGAPLLMEALPESRMVLLVRDPRDVVASVLDAAREGGWLYESRNGGGASKRRPPAEKRPRAFAGERARVYRRGVQNAKAAYDAHEGPKALVRYEDLVADTLGTMRRLYAALGIEVNPVELARAVEKHSWENVPEEEKGEGKFHRKGRPGGWREDLTEEQAKTVERITASLLEEFYPDERRV
jgi:hypothetical protein